MPKKCFPEFLQSESAFMQRLQADFDAVADKKGDRFAVFCAHLLNACGIGEGRGEPTGGTADGGIDLLWSDGEGSSLALGQAKFKITRLDVIDSIFSKFGQHTPFSELLGTTASGTDSMPLFASQSVSMMSKALASDEEQRIPKIRLFTTTKIGSLLRKYERSQLAARPLFEELNSRNLVEVYDLPRLFDLYRDLYRSRFLIPDEILLRLEHNVLSHSEGVFFGIAPLEEIRRIYQENKDGLFYENPREFIGFGKSKGRGDSTVNDEILGTLEDQPGAFLALNNGITFRAETVHFDEREKTLRLTHGAIINGCQTTRCIATANGPLDGFVACKVVVPTAELADSWRVSTTANHQNTISRIDLEISEFMRPQIVRRMRADLGEGDGGDVPLEALLEQGTQDRLHFQCMRDYFVGLFSNHPRNIFVGAHNRVDSEALEKLRRYLKEEHRREEFHETLIKLRQQSQAAVAAFYDSAVRRDVPGVAAFKRLFDKSRQYGSFIGILAIMFALDIPSERSLRERRGESVKEFLGSLKGLLENSPERYAGAVKNALLIVLHTARSRLGSDDAEVQKRLSGFFRDTSCNEYLESHQFRLAADDASL